jgi:hypothetical protein
MEENYNFVRQAAKEVLGGNEAFLKQMRERQRGAIDEDDGSDQ